MNKQSSHQARIILGACAAGLLLAGASAHAQALQLPAVKQAAQNQLLQEAAAQYQRYAAAPDTFFSIGAQKQAGWPCKVSAAELNKLTGLSNYAFGKGASGYGHQYDKIAIHPVAANCKNGKLDGQVDLVYEAVRQSWGPGFRHTTQETARVAATVAGGKVVHRLELRRSADLPGAAAAPSKPASIASSAENPHRAFITSATILVTDEGQKYFLKRPVKTSRGMRLERAFYNGAALFSVEQTDARGKPDGLSISYKGGAESKSCFRHGKAVDLKACGLDTKQ